MTSSKIVAEHLQAYQGAVEELAALLAFPYPKSTSNLRWLHVASPDELIVLRTAAGHVIRSTDQLLSSRVYSNRLDRRYRCWRFRDQKNAWSRFRKRGLSLLDKRRHSSMCRTDVAGYYPSVNIERLRSLIEKCGCLGAATSLILRMFRDWQLRDRLQGVPIGPEVSAVFGNFLLAPVDGWLEASGHEHLRWSDDILLFGQTLASCHGAMSVVDEVLSDLQLTRSVDKNARFDNVLDARRNLQDELLASLTDFLAVNDDIGMEAVYWAYDSKIVGNPEVGQKHFRWIVKALLNKNDSYACRSLASDRSVMNVDPKLSGQYLKQVGLSGKRVKDRHVVDAILDHLSKPPEDRFHALNLHLLNALRHRRFGEPEAKEFRRIATDLDRPWPVRVYGWAAYIGTTQSYSELMEAARAETIPPLRRGMIAILRGRTRQTFLAHAQVNFPESRYTLQWAQAA